MRGIVTAALLALAGCATTTGYRQMVDTCVGASEQDLLRLFGAPTARRHDSRGRTTLTYVMDTGPVSTGGGGGRNVGGGGGFIGSDRDWCETQFSLDGQARVRGVFFKGNDCEAWQRTFWKFPLADLPFLCAAP